MSTALYPTSDEKPSYGQLFIYDGEEANKCRTERNKSLDQDLLRMIDKLMRLHNVHAKSFIMMGEESRAQEERSRLNNQCTPELKMLFSFKKGFEAHRYNPQRHNEVAAIFTTTSEGEIPDAYVTIISKNTKQLKNINSMDANVEPWLYPLFYPFGTQAWHVKLQKTNGRKITRQNYVRYRLAVRNNEFNAFLRGRRLTQ